MATQDSESAGPHAAGLGGVVVSVQGRPRTRPGALCESELCNGPPVAHMETCGIKNEMLKHGLGKEVLWQVVRLCC